MSDSSYTHLRAVVYLSEAEGQSVERIRRLRGSLVHDLFGGSWRYLPGRLATWWVRTTHFDIAEDQSESKTWIACKLRQRCREPKIVVLI
jgi:hypothetical protein